MPDMADIDDEIRALQMRVDRLETWAGPGQAEAFATGFRGVRGDLAVMRRIQDRHTALLTGLRGEVTGLRAEVTSLSARVGGLAADVAAMKADVAELKADMVDVKATLREILRRLPPAADGG